MRGSKCSRNPNLYPQQSNNHNTNKKQGNDTHTTFVIKTFEIKALKSKWVKRLVDEVNG